MAGRVWNNGALILLERKTTVPTTPVSRQAASIEIEGGPENDVGEGQDVGEPRCSLTRWRGGTGGVCFPKSNTRANTEVGALGG